ncbi:TetR/AcrR family transcriptional regulator [Lacrimispora sp. JR3]|uniref:TetR/AcrR family transcriptional regulator n=1 Tax=Lacrimispora sinapis TaxID=3111456 RepID=UPI00374A0049
MEDRTDLRVVKTLESIKNGFAFCIKQKKFSNLTVTDLTAAARINRSTFYKYYNDKYDLRDFLITSTLEELSAQINMEPFHLEHNRVNISLDLLRKQLQFMYDHKEWYLILWDKNTELYVFDDMLHIFEQRTRENFSNLLHQTQNTEFHLTEKQELFVRLFSSSAMTTVKWWYEYAPNLSSADVSQIIIDNIKYGMRAFL